MSEAPPPGPGGTHREPLSTLVPGGATPAGATEEGPPTLEGGTEHRFWSRRRVPAAIVSLLLLAAAGLALYEIVSVRAGRPAMQWRKTLANDLAERQLDDTAVLAGAAACAALGLWLLLLALTPGRRGLLPMRRTHDEVRAALHRKAASQVLRDRAMEVPGVWSAAVRTKRRKVKVKATAHFRELDDVRTDLGAALHDGIDQLGLARPPSLKLRVARPGRRD
ncbi:DUF6286 domain-containing protein [Streptomyces sp. NPDC050560]|uniref:DUF6286 domain-containing protein n=1 Tax=Streptomyces sp. NPDC050560 TaxID=3365630 RepID=UPI0037A88F7A